MLVLAHASVDQRRMAPGLRVRPMFRDLPDAQLMPRQAMHRGFRASIEAAPTFGPDGQRRHLGPVLILLRRHADLPRVLDSEMKLGVDDSRLCFAWWAEGVERIVGKRRGICKVSRQITEAGPGWKDEDFGPVSAQC
ncbi:MAG: hypothetical protein ACK4GO_12240 [Gemmobacter sp.]